MFRKCTFSFLESCDVLSIARVTLGVAVKAFKKTHSDPVGVFLRLPVQKRQKQWPLGLLVFAAHLFAAVLGLRRKVQDC